MGKMMKGADYERWQERNRRENADRDCPPGDRIKDCYSSSSTVRHVRLPQPGHTDDHVWNLDNIGDDMYSPDRILSYKKPRNRTKRP